MHISLQATCQTVFSRKRQGNSPPFPCSVWVAHQHWSSKVNAEQTTRVHLVQKQLHFGCNKLSINQLIGLLYVQSLVIYSLFPKAICCLFAIIAPWPAHLKGSNNYRDCHRDGWQVCNGRGFFTLPMAVCHFEWQKPVCAWVKNEWKLQCKLWILRLSTHHTLKALMRQRKQGTGRSYNYSYTRRGTGPVHNDKCRQIKRRVSGLAWLA